MEKILIVEDEEEIACGLSSLLKNQGYVCDGWDGRGNAVEIIRETAPDLILMDINLPGQDGFALCREIRNACSLPVIFLTGRSTSMDELEALQSGGDDFITKPYKAPILLARIQTVLRRVKGPSKPAVLQYRGITLDLGAARLTYGEKSLELGRNEQKILHRLFEHAGNIVSREELVDYLWENQIYIDDNTLSVNVRRLREKLAAIGLPGLIQTKGGWGIRYEVQRVFGGQDRRSAFAAWCSLGSFCVFNSAWGTVKGSSPASHYLVRDFCCLDRVFFLQGEEIFYRAYGYGQGNGKTMAGHRDLKSTGYL